MAKKNVDLITGHQELISFDLSLKKNITIMNYLPSLTYFDIKAWVFWSNPPGSGI